MLRSEDTGRTVEADHWTRAAHAARAAAAVAHRPLLRSTQPDADDHVGIARRRRHRRILGAERGRLRRVRRLEPSSLRAGSAAPDRHEHRGAGDQRPHRTAGLPPGALRRRRRAGARGGRHPPRAARYRRRASSNSVWCCATRANLATRAPTTGRSPRSTSTATATSSTASSVSAIRRPRCARRSSGRLGRRRPRHRRRMGQPEATGARRDDRGHRRSDRPRAARPERRPPRSAAPAAAAACSATVRRISATRSPRRSPQGGARILDFRIERHGLTRG